MHIAIFTCILSIFLQTPSTAPIKTEEIINTWLWKEGTRYVGTELVFTADNKIVIKPNGEKFYIFGNDYSSNWKKTLFRKSTLEAAFGSSNKNFHMLPPDLKFPYDISSVGFRFTNLKITRKGSSLEMEGICTYSIAYGRKGETQETIFKEDNVPVKFIASWRPAQPNPNVVGNKPMPSSAQNESLINKSATDVINQALSDSKGNIAGAEAIVEKMRRASQEASDNPALIRAQYWLKGRNGANIFGESTAYFLGSAYLTAKEWGIGFDSLSAWFGQLPWKPAPYDPATREWYNNGVQNILPSK